MPVTENARFSIRSAFGLNRDIELPDDVVEHKYIAEYLNIQQQNLQQKR